MTLSVSSSCTMEASCVNTLKNITMGIYLFFQHCAGHFMLSQLQDAQCSFHAGGHNFLRNDLPTETSEVIYQLDDYRSWSSI